jgi:predicted nucleic acid-binding Zn ribbon protein
MSLKSVNQIFDILKNQAQLQEPPLVMLIKCWQDIVGSVFASHTRPVMIQRDVLRVATSSASWAQNLTFERKRLLLKVNEKLATPLVDIHFSTAGWHGLPLPKPENKIVSPREHPSFLDSHDTSPNVNPNVNNFHPRRADKAFSNWAERVKARSQNLPLCSSCQCPTPPGEIERWGVCALCGAKRQYTSEQEV